MSSPFADAATEMIILRSDDDGVSEAAEERKRSSHSELIANAFGKIKASVAAVLRRIFLLQFVERFKVLHQLSGSISISQSQSHAVKLYLSFLIQVHNLSSIYHLHLIFFPV